MYITDRLTNHYNPPLPQYQQETVAFFYWTSCACTYVSTLETLKFKLVDGTAFNIHLTWPSVILLLLHVLHLIKIRGMRFAVNLNQIISLLVTIPTYECWNSVYIKLLLSYYAICISEKNQSLVYWIK